MGCTKMCIRYSSKRSIGFRCGLDPWARWHSLLLVWEVWTIVFSCFGTYSLFKFQCVCIHFVTQHLLRLGMLVHICLHSNVQPTLCFEISNQTRTFLSLYSFSDHENMSQNTFILSQSPRMLLNNVETSSLLTAPQTILFFFFFIQQDPSITMNMF